MLYRGMTALALFHEPSTLVGRIRTVYTVRSVISLMGTIFDTESVAILLRSAEAFVLVAMRPRL